LAQRWAISLLLLIMTVTLSAPVYAHTTLGDLGSGPLHRSNDHELNPTNTFGTAHVPGPLGYVWPGSGLDMYSGNPSNPPGYQSPFTTYEEPTQVAGNAYAPEGAILTSTPDHDSVGDLMFAINFSQPRAFVTDTTPKPNFTYTSIAIYVPAPVFDKTGALVQDGFEPAGGINWDTGDNTNIVTTITDNYADIFVTRADMHDPFEPGSWLIYITAPNNITFTAARHWSEWYYVRINQMRAPEVAGTYFFKMFLDDHYPTHSQSATPNTINSTMPMENWPILLVKGEVDPGIMYGTVRYGDPSNSTLYGQPLSLPGRVRAVGVAIDPVTGAPTGRAVEARGYFNATLHGHFEIEGVAPGIYDIYASAAGFPEQKVAEGVTIQRGQSWGLDVYLKVGPVIRGEVFSKGFFGPDTWPGQLPITVVVYDSNSYDADSIVTYSPSNLTHAPYTSYVTGNTLFSGNRLLPPNQPKLVAFPWDGPVGYYTYTSGPTFKDPFGVFNGVGPAQSWWVDPSGSVDPSTYLGSTSTEFVFQFGSKSVYGAPAKFSGMVPQVFATWTASLGPGTYYVRVYANGYVQTNNDGTKFIDYFFQVPDLGYSRNVLVPIDLVRSPTINVTVHFHDFSGTLQQAPVGGPDPARILIAEGFARDGTLAALNFTSVPSTSSQATITLDGLGMAGPLLPPDPRASMKYSLARYRGLYDYGLPTDSYTIRVFMRGYIQALPPADTFDDLDQPVSVTISIGTGLALVSTHMYRGGGINATLYSEDWETPPDPRNWVWNDTSVSALVYDIASKNFVDVIYFWNAANNQWMIPTQDSQYSSLPWPGWKTTYGQKASLLVTNGSTLVDRFGPDIPNSPSLTPSQDMVTMVFLEENFQTGFLYSSSSYRTDTFRSALAIYPGTYALNVWTYGYVQSNVASLGDLGNVQVAIAWLGDIADTSVHALIGVNLTIRMLFKTEKIFAGIPYNSSIRIRVFDESDTLVAAASIFSDGGTLVPNSQSGFFADGKKLLQQPIPAGTRTLEYESLAGLVGYVEPSTGGASVRTATLFSPDHGVWGRSTHPGSYTGTWLVMVDMVNWYLPDSYYPPVPALLQGESPYFFPYNHLGPYSQGTYTIIPNTRLGSEASVEFELDLRGYVSGEVLGADWSDETRTISWASIQLQANSTTYYWYSLDGWFDGYLDPGQYPVYITEWTSRGEGHLTYQTNIYVSPGQGNRALIVTLDESGIPIPELSVTLPSIVFALSATVAVLSIVRRSKRRK
jgi:hypothetical protein